MPTSRIPLTQPIETRDGTLTKDSKCVNGYFESREGKREFVKRPGLKAMTLSPAISAGEGQGITFFNGNLYCVVDNVLYKVIPSTGVVSTVGTLTGDIQQCYFTQTLNNGYLFVHNQTNGYLVNGSTGAFTQITNDRVASVTLLTGGTGYVNPTVTFSAPSSGTTATGTVQYTTGVVIGVTITNAGSGYTTETTPTVTITDNNLSITCTNTSGTNTLTTSTAVDAGITGATITGTGIPSSTTISSVSGNVITISNNTTSGVTSATITAQGTGATATSLLNFFPTGGLVPGAVFLDSYIAVGTPAGRLYTCNVGDPTIWNPLDYLTAEAEPDNSVGICKHLNYILNFGQWSTEVFYDNGNATGSPLEPAQAYKLEIGCADGNSIVQFEQTVMWVGTSQTVGAGVYLIDGTSPVKVSTPYIERILGNSALKATRAYAVKYNGHMFYVLTLHDINKTIVYDFNEKMWYQWTMWAIGNPDTGAAATYGEQYFRPSYFAGKRDTNYYFLDDDTGVIYNMSSSIYTDDGAPIYYRCVTDIVDSGTTKRKFYQRLEIIGDKVPATMMIRHTGDDYKTWSSYRSVDLNKARSQIYQSGADRRRAWEFLCTDPVPIRIDSAEVDFKIGELENEGLQPPQYRK